LVQRPLSRFLPLSRIRVAALALLLAAYGIGITVLSMDLLRQIETQSGSKLDNVQWALSQVEVELIHFILATDAARRNLVPLSEVRLRYDIFFSRLRTLSEGRIFGELRDRPEFKFSFARLDGFMDRMAPRIDGTDAELRQELTSLGTQAHLLVRDARVIALIGVQVFAASSDMERRSVERTLLVTGGLALILVATLVALILMLMRLYRLNRLRAAQNLEILSRLDATIAAALEPIIVLDDMGRIVDFNPAARQSFGYDRAEAIGKDLLELIGARSEPQTIFRSGAPPKDPGQGRVRMMTQHKSGRVFPVEVSISRTQTGGKVLFVAYLRDLSAQLAAEQALVAARDEALAGEKAKADILVVMSHEIRTPLNGMIGAIELLEDTPLQAQQREYLRILQASGKLLMHHVNDVLDIARLDSGKAPFLPGPVDLAVLVGEVLENQSQASRDNGNRLRYEGPLPGQMVVLAEVGLLRQVLLNLVGNAMKFTRKGLITVQVQCEAVSGMTVIRVSDTGIGIPKADLGRIFEDFVTLDASYARRAAGTGLGLGIVRRIVTKMGGTLTVESELSRGSSFVVSLPLTLLDDVDLPTPEAATPPALHGAARSVLVVEDNEFNRLIVREMLQQEGCDVVEARDGVEGIQRAAERRFDLILMDISMPRVDGLQATQAILASIGPSAKTPIVAMTAHAMQKDTARFRAVGITQSLVKPITRGSLRAVLGGVIDAVVVPAETSGDGLIDIAVLQEMAQDLGAERAQALLQKFLTETDGLLEGIMADLASDARFNEAKRTAHRLAGSAAMFGAVGLHRLLAQMEMAWKSGQTDVVRRDAAGLTDLWQHTRTALYDLVVVRQLSSLR